MRWGVRDEATDDHMTTTLCMQEIDNCQRLSIGPNFIVSLYSFSYFCGINAFEWKFEKILKEVFVSFFFVNRAF